MKYTRYLPICLALAMLLSACGTADTDAVEQAEEIEAHEVVYGKIRSAYGNEITVALLDYEEIEMPTFPGGDGEAAPGEVNRDFEAGESVAEAREAAGGDAIGFAPGTMGTGSAPAMRSDRGGSSGGIQGGPPGDRPGGMGAMGGGAAQTGGNYTLTGEDATYIIPVTATITTGSGENVQTVRFTQLSYKNVVKLSLDEHGNVIAVDVLE